MMDWSKYLNIDRLKPTSRNTGGDPRNEFESDFGRVVFSPAIRRMHDKTQVFPLTTDDNIHSRLTHSMEVMAIGYSLGLKLCENPNFIKIIKKDKYEAFREIPVILKNACLVHDIGNPPFGHFGEKVINNYFKQLFENTTNEDNVVKYKLSELEKEDFTEFDGNAQGFRLLTKLQVLDNEYGLNLTFGTLGAFLKYPNSGKIDRLILSKSKRGVFQSEAKYLEKIADGCGLVVKDSYVRHPLSFLMEAADSICYLVMDLEDGFNKSWYSYSFIKDFFISKKTSFSKVFDKLEEKHSEFNAEISRVVSFRIYLIAQLVELAVQNFMSSIDAICNGEYNKELIEDGDDSLASILRVFTKENIFPHREIQSLELTGHSVLTGLLDCYVKFVFHENKDYRKRAQGLISKSILKAAFLENQLPEKSSLDQLNDYYKLRVIVDFISGMTDQFALDHYQKLSGQKII